MAVVCDICGKSCSGLSHIKIKDGNICLDCSVKFDAMIGKHDNMSVSTVQYKEIMLHPAQAQKLPKEIKDKNKCCCVCGEKGYGKSIKDGLLLCSQCVQNCEMVSEDAIKNPNEFFSTHGESYFKSELEECYNPRYNIAFDFKTKKIHLKDALRKKNYKIIDFEDVVSCKVNVENTVFTGGCDARFLELDYKNGTSTERYVAEDSMDKHYEFDKTIDCISRIPHIDIQNINNAQVNKAAGNNGSAQGSISKILCPKCGGQNCTPVVETSTAGKDFSVGKGCCGLALLGPLGLLCGACGKGKQTTSTTYWMCSNCGNKFTR